VLTLTALAKSFGTRRVLDGLNLHVAAGESVALLGANGSGKTTTLRCVVGLAKPDGGRITLGGCDVASDQAGARKRVSYLPQKPAFPSTLTVRETLSVVAQLRGMTVADVDREIEACQLTTLAARNVVELSGGERQRLAMAVAFLPVVDVYLFDEPSANLDPTASRILFRRARQLQRGGRTLVFTTHIPADVRRLATRAVFLRDGRIESEASGEFELRRYERMLEHDLWGDDDEGARSCGDGDRDAGPGGLRGARAIA
jgi:ABC-type multidrug transport system ATPase subunit